MDNLFLSIQAFNSQGFTDKTALERMAGKSILPYFFVVDIYNEGVDIPEVNTVLDFIGQANRKYNFEDKFSALLSNTTRSVTRELKDGFVSVPKGCYIQLEKKAAKYILDNIRASYGNSAGLLSRIASFADGSGLALTLARFAAVDSRRWIAFLPDILPRFNDVDFAALPENGLDVFFGTLNKADQGLLAHDYV